MFSIITYITLKLWKPELFIAGDVNTYVTLKLINKKFSCRPYLYPRFIDLVVLAIWPPVFASY